MQEILQIRGTRGIFDVTYEDVKEGCEAFLQYLIENEPLY